MCDEEQLEVPLLAAVRDDAAQGVRQPDAVGFVQIGGRLVQLLTSHVSRGNKEYNTIKREKNNNNNVNYSYNSYKQTHFHRNRQPLHNAN